jgi:hypothetical protein
MLTAAAAVTFRGKTRRSGERNADRESRQHRGDRSEHGIMHSSLLVDDSFDDVLV